MQLQQELDPRIERLLRLVGSINVSRLPTLHEPLLMVHGSINHAVPNRFGHNVLCVLLRVEGQFGRDVREGDARVGEREGAQGGFDDVVAQAEDEGGSRVGGEGCGVGGEGRVEGVDVADADGWWELGERESEKGEGSRWVERGVVEEGEVGGSVSSKKESGRETTRSASISPSPSLSSLDLQQLTLDNLQIRHQRLPQHGLPKRLPLGNLAHEQLDDNGQLVRRLEEPRRDFGFRRATDRLLEGGVGRGVVELDRADTACWCV